MDYFHQMNFNGDTNIGLYGFATDKFCLTGISDKKIKQKLKDVLKVKIYSCRFIGIDFSKLFSAGNLSGIVLSSIIPAYELKGFKDIFDFETKVIKSNYAIGNFILMNDKGILLSPELRKMKEDIENFFSLKTTITTIAGLNIIGSLGIANNKGCLVNPDATEKEIDVIRNTLDVEVNIGTVSFGSPYAGAGIIANSNGFLASGSTSGSELGRITEALGFL